MHTYVACWFARRLYYAWGSLESCHTYVKESCPTYEWATHVLLCLSGVRLLIPVWHDSYIRMTWLMHTYVACRFVRRHCYAWGVWHDSCTHVWHDSCACGTWLVHMCEVTHASVYSYVWHDSCTHVWHASCIHVCHNSCTYTLQVDSRGDTATPEVQMIHVTLAKESCPTYKLVISHLWMSHAPPVNRLILTSSFSY
jgi:hypothetical protein